jgi:large repetitive protein
VTIPGDAPAGVQYLIFVADATGQQSETDETNNARAAQITVGAPDLQVTGVSVLPLNPKSSETITVSWNVANHGDRATHNNWYDRVRIENLTTGQTLLNATCSTMPARWEPSP